MEYLVPPWKHQLEAIEKARRLPNFGLFFEMGAGKTSTAINILREKYNSARSVLRTMIFCPPIVVPNWRDEWLRHSKIDPSKVVLLQGSAKKRLKTFQESGGSIFVTNYEALLMPELYAAFQAWEPQAVVADESHRLKSPTSRRSKLMAKLVNKPIRPFVYLLTGSPILNSPMDIFQQFLILDGGETFGQNFFIFRARFFRDKNAGMPKQKYFPDWQIRPGALDEINRLLKTKSMRVEKKDCMDLPPLVRQTRYVEMTPGQAALYKSMKQELLAVIDKDRFSMATLAITKALRLQQIASGYIKTTDGEEIALEGNPKQEALAEILEDLQPNKVLVWAVWKQNYEQIRQVCDKLGLRYVEVHGDISDKQKHENVRIFTEDPEVKVLIGHPGSGGIGVNLVVAPYTVVYSRTFSLEHSLQLEARNHRGGSEIHDKITRIDLVTQNTIEEIVMKRLADKTEVSDKILADLSAELRKQEI